MSENFLTKYHKNQGLISWHASCISLGDPC
ncbi:Uncharacterised protein [Vibrio cholerae]|nr:Uncharacterised protein [Vibrio cholerae]